MNKMKTIIKFSIGLFCAMALGSSSFADCKPATTGHPVPISGAFATTFRTLTPPPVLEVAISGMGITSHLGKTTLGIQQVVDFTRPGAPITGTFIIQAANGDELHGEMNLTSTPPVDGKVTFEGPITFISGTGRFQNVSGSAWLIGSAQFTGHDSGFGELVFAGDISW